MPPTGRLSEDEIDTLVKWVEMGAPWPELEIAGGGKTSDGQGNLAGSQGHWAWKPVQRVSPPPIHAIIWPADPIDNFVLNKLEAEGLTPSSEADRYTLLRRIHFDLTGLSPGARRPRVVCQRRFRTRLREGRRAASKISRIRRALGTALARPDQLRRQSGPGSPHPRPGKPGDTATTSSKRSIPTSPTTASFKSRSRETSSPGRLTTNAVSSSWPRASWPSGPGPWWTPTKRSSAWMSWTISSIPWAAPFRD